MKIKISLFFILLFSCVHSYTQEVLSGLFDSPLLQNASNSLKLKSTTSDTNILSLPIIDDFSYRSQYPSSKIWTDHAAYVNTNYALNPPSIGVVTLDAFDSTGNIYAHASSISSVGDYLSSRKIDLKTICHLQTATDTYAIAWHSLIFNNPFSGKNQNADSLFKKLTDTTYIKIKEADFYNTALAFYYIKDCDTCFGLFSDSLLYKSIKNGVLKISRNDIKQHQYTTADSIYLSFYYQPKGLSDYPDEDDSLVVEFYSPYDSEWHWMWSITGSKLADFKPVLIPINNIKYLQRNFRFRFKSYISLNTSDAPDAQKSNVDSWHIDYVYLGSGRNNKDIYSKDVAFVEPITSILKDIECMPYNHFTFAYSTLLKSSFRLNYKNNYNLTSLFTYRYFKVRDVDMDSLHTYDLGEKSPALLQKDNVQIDLENDFFPAQYSGNESAIFHLMGILKTDEDDFIKSNDTLIYQQNFLNYYAYDDGTAEAGYGLKGDAKYAKVAYLFNNYKNDSVHAIDIYFNRSADSTLVNTPFTLMMWNDNSGLPGSVIYSQAGIRPLYSGLNEFQRFFLTSPLVLQGKYYIGWQQVKDKFLNIGFDLNRNAKSKLFYQLSNVWEGSGFSGALMMHPVVGKKPSKIVAIEEIKDNKDINVTIYPNPADEYLAYTLDDGIEISSVRIFNMQGSALYSATEFFAEISLQGFSEGIYIIHITTTDGRLVSRKFIIRR